MSGDGGVPATRPCAFRMLSRAGDEWVEHARGQVTATPAAPEAPEAAARRCDLAELLAEVGGRELSAEEALASTTTTAGGQRFLVTGHHWEALEAVYVGEGEGAVLLSLPEELAHETERLSLHPSLLDIAAGSVQLLAAGDFLPLAYERLVTFGALPARGLSHLRLRGGGIGEAEVLTCDASLYDQGGEERLRIEGFTMRRVTGDAAARLFAHGGTGDAELGADGDSEAWAAEAGEAGVEVGLSAAEGVETFLRALTAGVSSLVVSPRDLEAVRRQVRRLDRDRLAEELAALGPAISGGGVRRSAEEFQLPTGDLQQRIAAAWQRVLGVEEIGANDNFFELGGTSLAGIQLVSELKSDLGVEIPTVALFEAPTVAALARHLAPEESTAATSERIESRAEKKRAALAARRSRPRPAPVGPGGSA